MQREHSKVLDAAGLVPARNLAPVKFCAGSGLGENSKSNSDKFVPLFPELSLVATAIATATTGEIVAGGWDLAYWEFRGGATMPRS